MLLISARAGGACASGVLDTLWRPAASGERPLRLHVGPVGNQFFADLRVPQRLQFSLIGPRWGGYDEFAFTLELAILVFANVISAAFFVFCFYVLGVGHVLFKALFVFHCTVLPRRLLADVINRFTATKELRKFGPIDT